MQSFLHNQSHDIMAESGDSHMTYHQFLGHSGSEFVAHESQNHSIHLFWNIHIALHHVGECERGRDGRACILE